MKKQWRGDPCSPVEYRWAGLNCSYSPEPQSITAVWGDPCSPVEYQRSDVLEHGWSDEIYASSVKMAQRFFCITILQLEQSSWFDASELYEST